MSHKTDSLALPSSLSMHHMTWSFVVHGVCGVRMRTQRTNWTTKREINNYLKFKLVY